MSEESRTRVIVVPNHGFHLSGSRFRLGSFVNKITKWENGAWTESWKTSDGAFREDAVTYTPDTEFQSARLIRDENHGANPVGRGGGPMKLLVFENNPPKRGVFAPGIYTNLYNTIRYEGGFMPPARTAWANYPSEYISANSAFFADVSGLGRRAWKATKPNLQRADIYVFAKESKEVAGMFRTTMRAPSEIIGGLREGAKNWDNYFRSELSYKEYRNGTFSKAVSNQYLNTVFGWMPFIRDLVNLHKAYHHGHTMIEKIIDANGRWIRRRVPLNTLSENSKLLSGNYGGYNSISYPIHVFPRSFPSGFFSGVPSWELWQSTERTETAVGKWKFYRPEFSLSFAPQHDTMTTLQRWLIISGSRPSPANIYKAIPWTWLIDWFVGLGDYIDYLDDIWLDSVASEYCYAMCHERVTRRFIQRLPFASGPVSLEFTRFHESKQRIGAASPFDWDLPVSGKITERQQLILAALSQTRKRPGRNL